MRKLLIAVVAVTATAVLASSAYAIDEVNTKRLRQAVGLNSILAHERALQRIALANDNNRAASTAGYDASLDYFRERMRDAGYRVYTDEFDFPSWTQDGPATLAQVTPTTTTYAEETDYLVAQFSGAGNLDNAEVIAIGPIQIPVPGEGASISGCAAGDFPAATAGKIALIQRGTCPFTQKIQNAKTAGAAGVLIFNDGWQTRTGPVAVTAPPYVGIPVATTSFAVGQALYTATQQGTVTMDFVVNATTTPNAQYNLIADSRRGNPDRTILVGGHLDSVEEGPGINDNGSGVSAMAEVAKEIADLPRNPRNRLRFAFWGAEEAGLVGSTAYVADQVASGDIEQIEANLNFDMLGSPNFVRFVYDGDNSTNSPGAAVGPPGSDDIEQMFVDYFESQGLESEPTPFDGRSDYGPFIARGVPAGGLFSGAEDPKTEEQETIYGGFAGMPYDECYHQACDSFFNLSHESLDQMSDAVAHATWTLARSRSPLDAGTAAAAKVSKAQKAKKAKKARRSAKRMGYKAGFSVR